MDHPRAGLGLREQVAVAIDPRAEHRARGISGVRHQTGALAFAEHPEHQGGDVEVDEDPLRAVLPVPAALRIGEIVATDEVDDRRAGDLAAGPVAGFVETRPAAVDQQPAPAAIQAQPAVHRRHIRPALHGAFDEFIDGHRTIR